jgi:hypothetical protein
MATRRRLVVTGGRQLGANDITKYLLIVVVSESLLSITCLDARPKLGLTAGITRTKMA